MVGEIKKWLGINRLEQENLRLAKVLLLHRKRIEQLELTRVEEIASIQENSLTSEPAKPKIVSKSKTMNWKNFRAAAEKASDPQEQEA